VPVGGFKDRSQGREGGKSEAHSRSCAVKAQDSAKAKAARHGSRSPSAPGSGLRRLPHQPTRPQPQPSSLVSSSRTLLVTPPVPVRLAQ